MNRNVTITEGGPDSDNSVELIVGHFFGEWGVGWVPDDPDQDPGTDWPMDSIEDWILDQIGDLPETLDEARDDPRMQIDDRSDQCDMDQVYLSNNPAARATYHEYNQEWVVKILTDDIADESLSDALSDEQDRVLLYNETATSQSEHPQRKPQTRRLTAFTGIGEATARKLGDDIHRIEELLDVETGTLTHEVRSVVSSQYHDSLQVEVRHWYQNAVRSRPEAELDPVDRKCLSGDLDWKDSLEDVEVINDVESMCLLFRDVVESGVQLRITMENHGEFAAQIGDTFHGEQTNVGVEIEPVSPPLESPGIIEVPAPYRGECPVYRYRKEPSGSDPITGGSIKIVRRAKITKVERQE